MTDNTEWAQHLARKGWLVFPSRNKKPLVRWSQQATCDPERIAQLWGTWPDADVCIKTGQESGLVVVDWDAYKQESVPSWQNFPLGPVPTTYSVKTSKGGYHFYFKHPGFRVRNSAGMLAEFVDVRGDGGMVVAYNPILLAPLADIPLAWVEEQTKVVDRDIDISAPASPYRGFLQWAENYKHQLIADIGRAEHGKRNFTLYAVASDLYRMVWSGCLDKDEVTQLLGDEALSIGLEPHEIAATLASAMRNAATQYQKGNA